MIIFDGYLTGESKKYFINKMLNRGSFVIVISLLFTIPIWAFLSNITGTFIEVMITLLSLIALSPLVFRICVSKKERQRINLKKVIINNERIKAISDKSNISNSISEVKEVRDFGEYYDIVFPARRFTSVYVCQKNLLSKGSIEKFESVFSGKIVRKY